MSTQHRIPTEGTHHATSKIPSPAPSPAPSLRRGLRRSPEGTQYATRTTYHASRITHHATSYPEPHSEPRRSPRQGRIHSARKWWSEHSQMRTICQHATPFPIPFALFAPFASLVVQTLHPQHQNFTNFSQLDHKFARVSQFCGIIRSERLFAIAEESRIFGRPSPDPV